MGPAIGSVASMQIIVRRERPADHAVVDALTRAAFAQAGSAEAPVEAGDCQRRGIGSALMHAVVAAADALGEAVVVLVGDQAYYRRFGFQPASTLGIVAPGATWGECFQARALHAWTPGPERSFDYAEPLQQL